MRNSSPLRYPGGKWRFTTFFTEFIAQNFIAPPLYIEPYAGGAGLALSLLFDKKVSGIWLNDLDPAIHACWHSMIYDSELFCEVLSGIPVTLEEWRRQKEIYAKGLESGTFALGFSTFFLNRTNNGRIGRAVAEKALVQGFWQPVIVALARSILAHHADYYRALEDANKSNDVTKWLRWFSAIALEAQYRTFAQIDFVIHKAKLLERLKGRINGRQEKVLLRMLREGPEGFEGGMSAKKYSTIAETAPATTTRDLAGLVEVGALIRSGELKYTRYELNIPVSNIPSITIDEVGRVHSKMTEG